MTLSTYVGIVEVVSGVLGAGFAFWGLRGVPSPAREIPVGAESACPCGSGKAFRRCHGELFEEDRAVVAVPHAVNRARAASIFVATLVLVIALATGLAGVLLLLGHPVGRTLSLLVQGLQIPSLSTTWLTYQLAVGLASECGISVVNIPGDIRLGFNMYVRPGVRVDFGIGGDGSQPSSVGVNLAALVLFLALWRGP